jgi:hypothetical protein
MLFSFCTAIGRTQPAAYVMHIERYTVWGFSTCAYAIQLMRRIWGCLHLAHQTV